MPEPIDVGKLRIPVEADLDPAFGARARAERQHLAEAAGVETAGAFRKAYQKSFGSKQGADTAKEFLSGIKLRFDRDMGDAKEALARGLTDRRAFQQAGQTAAKNYDDALLAEIKRRADVGTLDDRTFVALTSQLKLAGAEAGAQFGNGLQRGARDGMQGLVTAVRGLFLVQLVGIVGRGVAAMLRAWRRGLTALVDLVEHGYQVDQLRDSFERLAEQAGSAPDAVLAGLRRASRGMVRDTDLMKQANLAFQAGLPGSAEQMERLAYVSRRLAGALGRDATDAFKRMTEAIAKQQRRLLDELGIIVSASEAQKKYVEQLNAADPAHRRTVQSLTQAERVQAFYNAVLEQAEQKVKGLGAETNDAGVTFGFLKTQITNTLDQTALLAAQSPTLARMLGGLGADTDKAAESVSRLAASLAAMLEVALQTGATLKNSWIGKLIAGGVKTAITLVPGGVAARKLYEQNLDAILDRQARAAKLRDIASSTDQAQLLAKQADLQGRVLRQAKALTTASGEYAENLKKSIKLNGEEWIAVNKRLAQLKAANTPPNPTSTPLTDAELKKIESARKALEEQVRAYQALAPLRELGAAPAPEVPDTMEGKLQRIYEIDEQIRKIEEQITAARGQAPAGVRNVVAALEEENAALTASVRATRAQFENLPAVQAQMAKVVETIRHLQPAARLGDGSMRTISEATAGLTAALKARATAEEALRRAELANDPKRRARALNDLESAQKRVKTATAASMKVFEAAAKSGIISQDQLNALIAQMVDLLKAAGIATDDLAQKSASGWAEAAETAAELARGVLSIADAVGHLDDETRKALQAVVDLGEATAKLIGSDGTDIGAWVQAIGGAVSLVSTIVGAGGPAEHAAATMNDLIKALKDLQRTILKDISQKEVAADQAEVARAEALLASDSKVHSSQDYKRRRSFAYLAEDLGLADADDKEGAIEALKRWAQALDKKYGTNLAEFIENSDSEGFLLALDKLKKELGNVSLGSFGKDIQGRIDALNFTFDQLGDAAGSAEDKLKAFIAAIREAEKADPSKASQFDDELEKKLADAGPTAAQAWLDQIAQAWAASGMNSALIQATFGSGLTAEEIQALIEEANQLVEGAVTGSGVTAGGPGSTRLSVSITEMQANQLLAIGNSQLYELRAIHALIAGGTIPMPTLPAGGIVPPSPASLGLTSGGGGTTVQIGTVHVDGPEISISSIPAPADTHGWQQVGTQIQRSIADGFAQGLVDALQGAGIDRPRISARGTPLRSAR